MKRGGKKSVKEPKKKIEVKMPAITFVKAGRKTNSHIDKKKMTKLFSNFDKNRNQAVRLRKHLLDNFMRSTSGFSG